MKIISHRGAAGLALENTLQAIRAGLKLPVYAIELDVRRTKDSKLVLIHDPHTGRIANKKLTIQNSTFDELRALPLRNGGQIPALKEALELIGDRTRVMLDLKSSGLADDVIAIIKAHPKTNFLVSGRQHADAKRIHAALPHVPLLVQHHYDPMEIVYTARRMHANGICLNFWLMNPLTYRLARRKKLDVLVYTVNWRWMLRFFERLYPEAIIITNYPDKMV